LWYKEVAMEKTGGFELTSEELYLCKNGSVPSGLIERWGLTPQEILDIIESGQYVIKRV